jgi:hypothetical protein
MPTRAGNGLLRREELGVPDDPGSCSMGGGDKGNPALVRGVWGSVWLIATGWKPDRETW